MLIGHKSRDNSPVEIESTELLTHVLMLGRTGSGKTGAAVAVIEEAVLSGASAIVIDPKGDLTNLALAFPNLSAAEFAPWVESGKSAADEAARVRNGLGDLAGKVHTYKNAAEVVILTPGHTLAGRGVNVLPSFEPPSTNMPDVLLRERASDLVAGVLAAINVSGDPLTNPANVWLTDLLLRQWKRGKALPLDKWAHYLSEPPDSLTNIDGLSLEEFFPKRDRMKVARALIGFRRQAARWLDGSPLNIADMVGAQKPKITVFSLRHLEECDRQFFVSMLLSAIVDYMYRAPASNQLRLLVALDEARGYLPPYPHNPPTKAPLCKLLAQGRAQGIGVLIGTQNPNDIDYKALSNVGTWFLGRLRARDCARDLEAELSARNVDTETLLNIPQRTFLVLRRDGSSVTTHIRWTYSYLRGPINLDELSKLGMGPIYSIPVTPTVPPVVDINGQGRLTLNFNLANPNSCPASIAFSYSLDGATWAWATLRGKTSNLATSPGGAAHTIIWDTEADIGRIAADVRLHLVVNGTGTNAQTRVPVDNRNLPKRGLLARMFG